MSSCTYNYPCNATAATTATVYDASAYNNPYRCQQYCTDGCCYVFNPSNRCRLWGHWQPIFGWSVLIFFVALFFVTIVGPQCRMYYMAYIDAEVGAARRVNEQFRRRFPRLFAPEEERHVCVWCRWWSCPRTRWPCVNGAGGGHVPARDGRQEPAADNTDSCCVKLRSRWQLPCQCCMRQPQWCQWWCSRRKCWQSARAGGRPCG